MEGRRKWSLGEVGRVLAGIGMEYCGQGTGIIGRCLALEGWTAALDEGVPYGKGDGKGTEEESEFC